MQCKIENRCASGLGLPGVETMQLNSRVCLRPVGLQERGSNIPCWFIERRGKSEDRRTVRREPCVFYACRAVQDADHLG